MADKEKRKKRKKKMKHRKKRPLGTVLAELFGSVIKSALLLAVCFVMITPLQSCVFTDEGYIGAAKARSIAIGDAGVIPELAGNMQTEMVHIDDTYYYKVEFSGAVTEYRYVIDATDGTIIAQAVSHTNGDEK